MKSIYEKGLLLLLTTCLLFTVTSQRIYAASSNSEELELQKQEEIDGIFREINQIALEKAHAEFLDSFDLYKDSDEKTNLNNRISGKERVKLLEEREKELNLDLDKLNVRKIDTDDENDMAILSELSEASINSDQTLLSNPTDTAPDLKALATAFTLYTYDGTYNYKGATHTYRYIRVIDNKGHGTLVLNNEYDAVQKNIAQSVMSSVLSYNFGFAFSAFLGTVPVYGLIADYTLGTIFSVLDGVSNASSVVASGSESLYRIFMSSQTEMCYH